MVPIPSPHSMPPSTTLMATSAINGGCDRKYPSIRPMNTEMPVAPNMVRVTNDFPSIFSPASSKAMLTPYIVTATGTNPLVAKYTRVPRPAMPPITM